MGYSNINRRGCFQVDPFSKRFHTRLCWERRSECWPCTFGAAPSLANKHQDVGNTNSCCISASSQPAHAIFYHYCWNAYELVLWGLCTIFCFAKLHFLFQKPYFDVNLVNRGAGSFECWAQKLIQRNRSKVCSWLNEKTYRQRGWESLRGLGGKGRFKGLLIAREYLEAEVQIARKGMGDEPFFIFMTVNTLNVKHPLSKL